ncbi:TRAP transporter permease [Halalkalibacter oceani]|uniref:TRAP transporter permease n=1 Tax=Halalkalibacter oceani TaxID=1653776 RepID=UPI003399AF3C
MKVDANNQKIVPLEEVREKSSGNDKYRMFKGRFPKIVVTTIFFLIPLVGIMYVLGLHQTFGLTLYAEQYIGLFLALILCPVFLYIPATKHSSKEKVPWYDWVLSVLGLYVGLYLLFYYPDIIMRMTYVSTERFLVSTICVLLIMEAVRRVLGPVLLIIIAVFLSYGFLAPYLPGVFRGSKTSPDQLFNYLYIDPSSMMSMLNLAATIGLIFILFGQILLYFGGANILNDVAFSIFGRFRGGPAKGAIVGSSLVGSVTGNPVSNVLLTGTVTIPLMKKSGFSANQAGAIESVASTGGQLIPPVMGIAAFIIAETLGVPYTEVVLAALVPAIMYYLCLFLQIDLFSGREGITRLPKEKIPVLRHVLKKGWLVIPPFVALVYFLFFQGYTATVSGLYASVVALIFLALQREVFQKLFKLLCDVFVDTGKMMIEITIVLAAAGIVMGITGITGLGFNIGVILASFAEYGLFVLLAMSAIVCILLGMGLPSVAAYALVAVLVAPSLIELGVDPMAAHLFVFYFSILSNFTPPVAVCCFTAAPIAKGDPYKIGFRSMQLGLVAYLVPFLFVYAPELLLRYEPIVSWSETIGSIIVSLIACYLLAITVEGFLFRRLSVIKRGAVAILAICLVMPPSILEYSLFVNIIGFIGAVLFILLEWLFYKKTDLAIQSSKRSIM